MLISMGLGLGGGLGLQWPQRLGAQWAVISRNQDRTGPVPLFTSFFFLALWLPAIQVGSPGSLQALTGLYHCLETNMTTWRLNVHVAGND